MIIYILAGEAGLLHQIIFSVMNDKLLAVG